MEVTPVVTPVVTPIIKPWKIVVRPRRRWGVVVSWRGRCYSCHRTWEYTIREQAFEHAETHAWTCKKLHFNRMKALGRKKSNRCVSS